MMLMKRVVSPRHLGFQRLEGTTNEPYRNLTLRPTTKSTTTASETLQARTEPAKLTLILVQKSGTHHRCKLDLPGHMPEDEFEARKKLALSMPFVPANQSVPHEGAETPFGSVTETTAADTSFRDSKSGCEILEKCEQRSTLAGSSWEEHRIHDGKKCAPPQADGCIMAAAGRPTGNSGFNNYINLSWVPGRARYGERTGGNRNERKRNN